MFLLLFIWLKLTFFQHVFNVHAGKRSTIFFFHFISFIIYKAKLQHRQESKISPSIFKFTTRACKTRSYFSLTYFNLSFATALHSNERAIFPPILSAFFQACVCGKISQALNVGQKQRQEKTVCTRQRHLQAFHNVWLPSP